ncbi:UDP-N-acetylmuramoyl-L-alanyl-D-glutamate--2,6-diaminopimelate ligase [Alkalihalobacillus sp. LMS39]|uniref:UDP-N-acetylmuramoyl-L-alanyl-D-glutamate--2, 6-diaminopimelate ligase n=1 Tax=Alkalihalobacillus sp. LMS39 TaxID=2924032 RepID=UPI001FB2AAFF|nr:UDP-N-acetylmuramoyl-L-alanyl-D-glutamate--2,6-diaminopimelate ligase [Alkalihalobacillus sp. LMS39]UOE92933.1 UDP-N-acetylmuramoyl-L-alanyl-D-glutamate--2,6-diaminopimelate ligase [Alkalihalobacillus sp. LMS39]
MNLNQVIEPLLHVEKIGDENPNITSIEMDSRSVKQGSLFVCLKGFHVDGHDYIDEAINKGAVAILSERAIHVSVPVIVVKDTSLALAVIANHFFHYPTNQLTLIGVTGTNGKTTTTHIIEKMVQNAKRKTGLIGTMYKKIGEVTYETQNTTPESLELQRTFAQMVSNEVEVAIMEVSSHALDLGRVRGSNFDIGVFTNLTPDHLDYHETMEKYKQAKGLLFSQLGNRYDKDTRKVAVLNEDDPATNQYKRMTAAQVITYGIKQQSDVMAHSISMKTSGTHFNLKTPVGSSDVSMKLVGMFSVYNVLAAVSTSVALGIKLDTIVESIEQIEGVPGRFELVDAGQPFSVIVDYAHTADSLKNVLKTIKEFAKGDVWCIVGCGGDRDRTKRPLMAKIAVDWADYAIFTSDNPRSEDPIAIIDDMKAGVEGRDYHVVLDRKKAIETTIQKAKKEDVVIIAGKGHETYQIIGATTYEFDDRIVAKEAIRRVLE